MIQQQSALPIRKVSYGALAGAITSLAFYTYTHFTHNAIDPTVSASITTIVTFCASYLISPAVADSEMVNANKPTD